MGPPCPPDVPALDEDEARGNGKSGALMPVAVAIVGFGVGLGVGAAVVVLSRPLFAGSNRTDGRKEANR